VAGFRRNHRLGWIGIAGWFASEYALAAGGDEAKRAFEAMMTMRKIDVAAIEAARRG